MRELSFAVYAGQIGALLGPNGAGKTTALRCLATLVRPTRGTVRVAGRDVRKEPEAVRRSVGFLSAGMGLYERLTPHELLHFFGEMQGLRKPARASRVAQLIELFGIGAFADTCCGQLSSGQRQRVALARALVQDPPVLVLDEPTTGLDVVSADLLHSLLADERARGKAILLSTHDMAEVEQLADRVAVMAHGSLVAQGTAAEIVRDTHTANLARAFVRLVA